MIDTYVNEQDDFTQWKFGRTRSGDEEERWERGD